MCSRLMNQSNWLMDISLCNVPFGNALQPQGVVASAAGRQETLDVVNLKMFEDQENDEVSDSSS